MSRLYCLAALFAAGIAGSAGFTSTALAATGPAEDAFAAAIGATDVDLDASHVRQNGKRVAGTNNSLLPILGLELPQKPGAQKQGAQKQQPPEQGPWSAGAVAENGEAVEFQYVVILKQPVKLGALMMAGTVSDAKYLK